MQEKQKRTKLEITKERYDGTRGRKQARKATGN